MAGCIFKGIVKSRKGKDCIIVSGPHPEKLRTYANDGAKITADNVEAARQSEIIFLGVKPQMLTAVLAELAEAKIDFKSKLMISMAAGYPCSGIAKIIKSERIIRIMPNTPAKIALGTTGIYYGKGATAEDRELCKSMMQCIGSVIETESEEGINVLGCVAGSSLAFMYRFLESLIAETVKRGFSEADAREIIQKTALGMSSMCIAYPEKTIAQLREAVTSKGGTTIEGLKKMTEYKFENLMSATVQASMDRTHEFEEMFK